MLEQQYTTLRGELSGHFRSIYALEGKVQELGVEAGDAKIEKEELKKRIRELEERIDRLGREAEKQGTPEDAAQYLWNRGQSLISCDNERYQVYPDGFLAKRRREREEKSSVYGECNMYERTSRNGHSVADQKTQG